jgi:type I restriction enzyme S subunit
LGSGKVKKGDILFCLRGSLGKFSKVQEFSEGAIASSLVIVRPKLKVTTEFLLLYFDSKICADMIRDFGNGAAQPNLSAGSLKNFQIPFPPLHEQQRIVAILDEAFAAIAKAKANAEQNLKNARELFESYLQGVFENKGDGWEKKKLKEITIKIGSGATPKGGNESYKTEGISLIRSMNVHDFEFRERNLAFIDEQQAKELNNVTLQENDVLLNITGASVARCCVIPKEYLPARVNQHVSIIRAKKEIIDPLFLHLLLTSKYYKDQLLFTGEQGATRQAITKAQLEVFEVAFPKSLKAQQAIVKKLNVLSTETKKLEAIYQQKLNDLEELKKSILQKAFAGELRTEKALAI